MNNTLSDSFYNQQHLVVSNIDQPLVLLFTNEYLRWLVLPLPAERRDPPALHVVIQRICANGTHLGLRADMSDGEFLAHYLAARNRVFASSIEMANARRRCKWCGVTFRRTESVGRLSCRRHVGRQLTPLLWACCQGRSPCRACDHSDTGDEVQFSVLHVALLPVFRPLRENVVTTSVHADRVAITAIMDTTEATNVGGPMVYIRIND